MLFSAVHTKIEAARVYGFLTPFFCWRVTRIITLTLNRYHLLSPGSQQCPRGRPSFQSVNVRALPGYARDGIRTAAYNPESFIWFLPGTPQSDPAGRPPPQPAHKRLTSGHFDQQSGMSVYFTQSAFIAAAVTNEATTQKLMFYKPVA